MNGFNVYSKTNPFQFTINEIIFQIYDVEGFYVTIKTNEDNTMRLYKKYDFTPFDKSKTTQEFIQTRLLPFLEEFIVVPISMDLSQYGYK